MAWLMKNLCQGFLVALATAVGMFTLSPSRSDASGAQPAASVDVEPAHLPDPPPPVVAAAEKPIRYETRKEEQRDPRPAEPEVERTRPSEVELLQRMNEHLQAMRQEMALREARREAEAVAAQEAIADRQAVEVAAEQDALGRKRGAIEALVAAEHQLATGDSRVFGMLDAAFGDLPFPAQRSVQNAQGAVESRNLYQARYWIALAVRQTQTSFLAP